MMNIRETSYLNSRGGATVAKFPFWSIKTLLQIHDIEHFFHNEALVPMVRMFVKNFFNSLKNDFLEFKVLCFFFFNFWFELLIFKLCTIYWVRLQPINNSLLFRKCWNKLTQSSSFQTMTKTKIGKMPFRLQTLHLL